MRARVLVDNTPAGEIQGEWGLCVYIEQGDKKILLDTGASGLFLENAKEFGIDLSEVDLAVLSHAHADHANGMPAFFAINKKAKFYLQAKAGENCYSKGRFLYKYEGLPKGMLKQYRDRIAFVSDNYKLCEGVWLIPHKTAGLETIGKREKLYVRRGLRWFPDDFAHEQSLVLETEQGLAIFNIRCRRCVRFSARYGTAPIPSLRKCGPRSRKNRCAPWWAAFISIPEAKRRCGSLPGG